MQRDSSTSEETLTIPLQEKDRQPSYRWRLADLGVYAVWLSLVGLIVSRHEPWADEAQAWLLARDLPFTALWFKELRYEGCPGLWHSILWFAQHLLRIPYSGIGVIGMAAAALGVAFLLWRAPFPRPIRWLLAFSYFIAYQYAVIARPYVLLPGLLFAAAHFFRDKTHPGRMAFTLALLANVSAHGAVLAACIGLAYLAQGVPLWGKPTSNVRRSYVLSILVLVGVFVFLFFVLKPPPDAEALTLIRDVNRPTMWPRLWAGVNGAFFDSTPLTAVWLVLLGAWCFMRRGVGSVLLAVMVTAMAVFYGNYGWPHHQGTIFLPAVAGLWILWPETSELRSLPTLRLTFHKGFALFLGCLLGYQVMACANAMRNDYLYPYSGAEDAASYLQSVGAEHNRMMGFGYAMVGIEAYFDGHILINRPTAYFHHGDPLWGMHFDPAEIKALAPEYIVLPVLLYEPQSMLKQGYLPPMTALGYTLVHTSPGHSYSRQGFDTWQYYFVFKRNG